MRFAINTPNFGEYSDPRLMVELAREAEEAGWDGFVLWDHLLWTWPENQPGADPWLTLAAMASATSRIKLGPMVTPIPRRRPWHLAREATTLDHLSGGRVILGVGIGGDWFGDYSSFGEPTDPRAHGEMLDEGLDVLAGLWSGEPFNYEGKHYQIKDVQFLPSPVQQPRIPIWVAGQWPNKKPFRRAARWDGVFPIPKGEERAMTPDEMRDVLAYVKEHREGDGPYDVVCCGSTPADDPAQATAITASYAQAGVTWWMEGFFRSLEQTRERIGAGPPIL